MSQPLPTSNPQQSSPLSPPVDNPVENPIIPPPEDYSQRDVSTNPINYAIDSTEDEFKPSKVSRLIQFAVDELKRNYNIDPTGSEYVCIIATSLDKGETFKIICDSTEEQQWLGKEMWSAFKINKEMMDMKLKEDDIIRMAKQKLQEEKDQSGSV